jgi:hypothetical protein
MTTTNPDFPAGFVHAPFIALRGIRIYIHSTDLYDEILVGRERQVGHRLTAPLS